MKSKLSTKVAKDMVWLRKVEERVQNISSLVLRDLRGGRRRADLAEWEERSEEKRATEKSLSWSGDGRKQKVD